MARDGGGRPLAGARRSSSTSQEVSAEIGGLFRDLRRVLNLSMPELARRAATRIDVIEALERGDFRALPEWPETARIVTQLTAFAKIDARPVLAIMRHEMWQAGPDGRAGTRRAGGTFDHVSASLRHLAAGLRDALGSAVARLSGLFRGSSEEKSVPDGSGAGPRLAASIAGRRSLLAAAVTLPILLAAGLAEAGFFRASAGGLTPSLGGFARSIEDAWLFWTAPEREGLKWIDVDDPRARKADKLRPRDS